ncbi:uncharacterized protein K02A2.6-like [Macrosteles quadrilineatus]|uniref:uncharacterized protein K02A2.6-like n=1 Tax=Macrosteles quadrilineatus TaxID=74068 RepID=UPI0023E31161|nr:uncharacterized protein K02A2.6-like [Macrosteles quadrilineatus]
MNADQFNQFLTIFQEQQRQQQENQNKFIKEVLETVLKQNDQQTEIPRVNYSNVAPFENYDPKKEKFTCYLERFENYYTMKGLTDSTKIGQLLCISIGSDHYNNLNSFLGPEKQLKSLNYDELITAFKQLLIPKKNVVVSQHYFLNVFQKEHQSITEFVASLQRDIAECEFSVKCSCDQTVSIAEVFLRAQFIRGLRDDWLREQILQSTETTFEGILTRAIALEASKIESRELSKRSHSSNANFNICDDVNKVSHKARKSQFQTGNRPSRQQQGHSSHSRKRPDLKSLGIGNLCFRCGKDNHQASECRTDKSKLKCNKCNKQGHISKVCISTLIAEQKKINSPSAANYIQCCSPTESTSKFSDYGLNKVTNVNSSPKLLDLFEVNNDSDKYMITVNLNGKPQQFEVDTGAKFSLLAKNDFDKLKLDIPLETTNIAFRTYSGNIIKPEGKVKINVTYCGRCVKEELHIVPTGHEALLGRQWIRALGIELNKLNEDTNQSTQISQIKRIQSPEEIFQSFSNIFEEKIGCVPDFKVSLQLRNGAKPIFVKERNVPHALTDRVNKELDTLENEGIISPVEASDWGSPLVVIPKPDGGVRLCVDYKCGVNERLIQANHPIRRIDDVIDSLRNSKYFCKLDLYKAYLHLQVDEESSMIQTMTTHRGTYRVHRLSFGIKTAPSEFNRILSQILKGLRTTEAYFDDIIVHGSTIEECSENLQACLQRLSDYNLHVNRNKCSFFQEKIEYLGRVVEFNKISKSPTKILAVQQMPRPSNTEEVKRLLGLVSYYSRFIPDASTITYPLRRLLQKNMKWEWNSSCEAAFLQIKSELCSDRVLVPFDPALPLVLTTDASPTGLAAVLSHVTEGEEKPIAYGSRSLTVSERNYSQLDRESLAIIFGVSHFYYYLFGTHFTLVTDNAPISRIFQHNKALPQMTSGRLLRYASYLSGFNYTLKFKPGKENENVDCLSRAPLQQVNSTVDEIIANEVNQVYEQMIFEMSDEHITASTIRSETEKDPDLSRIVKDLKNKSDETEYTLVDGILFRQDCVIIPRSLRPSILNELHYTHLGITKMKQLARRYVYWPSIDKEIERIVRGCEKCALTCHSPPKVPKFIAPGHPATNGLAERSIQTLKNRLKAVSTDQTPIQTKIQNILQRYRATPLACGQSPAELYLHRKIRIRLNAIFPYKPQPSTTQSSPARSLYVGERVQVKLFINNKNIWQFGQVKKRLGKIHYLVVLDSSDRILKRHINQLRPTLVQSPKTKNVTFGPTQLFDVPRIPRRPEIHRNPDPVAAPEPRQPEEQSPAERAQAENVIPQREQADNTNARPQRKRHMPSRFRDYQI